jgi:hypothetical protein
MARTLSVTRWPLVSEAGAWGAPGKP